VSSADSHSCPVCGGTAALHAELDFGRPPTGGDDTAPVAYWLCADCGFCFAPEMARWSREELLSRVYNDDYVRHDPDSVELRPTENAKLLERLFGAHKGAIRHLDYGGGKGLLSRLLRDAGWDSTSYDPFFDRGVELRGLGKFSLVTAFEVIAHLPNVNRLMDEIYGLLADEALVLFSTVVSDGHIMPGLPLDWWYAAPGKGHISLHSRLSLTMLGAKRGFRFASLSEVAHVYCRTVPPWAARYVKE
jgi:methyltransferase family protein